MAVVIGNVRATFNAIAMVIDSERPPDFGGYPAIIDRLLVPFRAVTDEAEALAFLEVATKHR